MKPVLTSILLVMSVNGYSSELKMKPWRSYSNPIRMSKSFVHKFSLLPLKGKIKDTDKYWSSDYWPLFKGNINFRWNSPTPIGFKLDSPDRDQAIRMTQQELSTLAPSEKFDLLNGNYTYPLKKQVAKRSSPRRKEWEGICHGWAAAALNHKEPVPRTVTNADGIMIPFGSSDIKALLSYYYAYHYNPVSTHQMGRRCSGGKHCDDDMNAGAFHIVLTNKIGLDGESFIADIENKREVWNQVAYGYDSTVIQDDLRPSRTSAKGTVKIKRMKTRVRYLFNIVKNSWLPANGTPNQTFKDHIYEYDLDIDKSGKIIGGDWRSDLRPDFLWMVKPVSKFSQDFTRIERLLNDRAVRVKP